MRVIFAKDFYVHSSMILIFTGTEVGVPRNVISSFLCTSIAVQFSMLEANFTWACGARIIVPSVIL